MIFDVHTHMGPDLNNYAEKPLLDTTEPEGLIEAMDRAGIERACTFAPSCEGDEVEDYIYRDANRAIYAGVQRYPDRLVGFARINPHFRNEALDELRRCYEEYGFRGLKLNPDAEYFPANSTLIYPVLERCAEYGWPVIFHCGYYPFSEPALLLPVAEAFPETPIILAHLGYRHVADCIVIARRCPNVYLETSANSTQAAIRETVRAVGTKQVLFGSDMPFTFPDDVVKKIKTLPELDENGLADILGENVKTILKL